MIGTSKGVEVWLLGLCGGLLVAVSALFAASGWGMAVRTRGLSPGALVFYGSWALSLAVALRRKPRVAVRLMGYLMGLGWMLAALGSMVRASDAMRWHPVVLGVNLTFFILGLLSWGLCLRYQGRPGAAS